jgi:hypothetical protein
MPNTPQPLVSRSNQHFNVPRFNERSMSLKEEQPSKEENNGLV